MPAQDIFVDGTGTPQTQPVRPTRPPAKYSYPTKDYLANLPPGTKWFWNYDVNKKIPEQQGYRTVPSDWAAAWISQFQKPNQSYYANDPRRLAKYYNFGLAAPEGWKPPSWYDFDQISQAYAYMQAEQGDDWTKWKPFGADDPGGIYLTSLNQPPENFRLEGEVKPQEQVNNFISSLQTVEGMTEEDEIAMLLVKAGIDDEGNIDVDKLEETEIDKLYRFLYGGKAVEISPFMQEGVWEESELWQQVALSIMSPQPMEGRPEWSRALGSVVQTGMAAMGGWKTGTQLVALGALLGLGTGTAVGGPAGSLAGTVVGTLAGAGLGLYAFGSSMWGWDVDILNQAMRWMDISDEIMEKAIGVGYQLMSGDTKEVFQNLPAAWKSGRIAYEVGFTDVGNVALNIMSKGFEWAEKGVNALGGDVEWSSGQLANYSAGEIWALERAVWEPVMVQDGLIRGAALDHARSRVASGEPVEEVWGDMMMRYGFSGNIADFIMQMIVPGPIEVIPYLSNKALGKYADYKNFPHLQDAVDSSRGFLAVDIIPGFLQKPFEKVSRKQGWSVKVGEKSYPLVGTTPFFTTLDIYKNNLRKQTLPITAWPTKTVDVDTSVFDLNPAILALSGEVYDDFIFKHTVFDDATGTYTTDLDAVRADFRSYLNDNLKLADIDITDTKLKTVLDAAVENIEDVVLRAVLDSEGKGTDEINTAIQRAIVDHMNETVGMVIVDTKTMDFPYYPPITEWERKFAGITEEGRYSELEPYPAKRTFLQKITTLDPEAQAAISLTHMLTNTGGLLQGFENDPAGMFRLLRSAAGVEPAVVGKVLASLLDSPATRTTAPILKAFVDSGILDQMEANYTLTQPLRAKLDLLTRQFNEMPGEDTFQKMTPGKMLQMIEDDPKKVIQMLQRAEQSGHYPALKAFYEDMKSGALTAETLLGQFKVFTGKNYIPFTNEMLQAEIMQQLAGFADKYVADYFDIKPKSWYFRLSDAMKSYMSLAVLGFNPLYAIYNYVNNIVTRVEHGAFGMLSPKQINTFWERYKIKPAMLEVGLGMGKAGDVEHLGGSAVAKAMDKGDWISKFKKAGQKASRIGIFSNIAGKIEVAESRQATTIATMQMWDQIWRPGTGFSKMSPELETTLRQIHPQLPEQIYGLVAKGLNMDEVVGSLYSQQKIRAANDYLAQTMQELRISNPEVLQDLLVKTGVINELQDLLNSAHTRQEINSVYDYINDRIRAIAEQKFGEDLATIPEDVVSRIQAEGWSAMMPLWSELWSNYTAKRLLDIVENGIAAHAADAARDANQHDLARSIWRKRQAEQNAQWNRTKAMMLATTKGMIDAVGTDSANAQAYVNLMSEWSGEWSKFYAERNKIYNEYYDSGLTGAERKALWTRTNEKIADLYKSHLDIERTHLTKMFDEMGKVYEQTSHRPASEVNKWASDVIKAWDETGREITKFRDGLLKADLTDAELRTAWDKFNREILTPLISKQRDAMVKGAQELAKVQPADAPKVDVDVPPPPIVTPEMEAHNARIDLAVQLKAMINERAQRFADYKVTDAQRQLLAGVLGEVYSDTGDRHAVQKYLFDTTSVMDAPDAKVRAALDLLTSIDEQGNYVRVIPENIRSLMDGLLDAAYENQGQGSLYDGRPADNAPAADKAEYNKKKVETEHQKTVVEQQEVGEARLTRGQFRTKIRDAFNLNTQEQMAIMTLVDAHAEIWGAKEGKSADQWYVENIADIEFKTTKEIVKDLFKESRVKLGETTLLENGRRIIRAFKGATIEQAVHELAHVFRYDLDTAEIETYARWAGFEDVQDYLDLDAKWRAGRLKEGADGYARYITAEEKFADGFTKYLSEEMAADVAPPAMLNVFQKFSKWLMAILKGVDTEDVLPEISPEMKRVYDQLFFREDNLDKLANNKMILEHAPTGNTTTAIGVTSHVDYNFQYKIVSLYDLVTSHDLNFVLNKYFPQELQGRFRELGANQTQILSIVNEFNPNEILNDTMVVETGPMIIGQDMVVESGNGRTLALLMMARDYPEKWASYIDALQAHLEGKGFTPDALEGIDHPVLVRVRMDDVDRIAFTDDTNAARTSTKLTVEAAYGDAKYWDAQLLSALKVFVTTNIESLIKSENNKDVVQAYLNTYPPNERSRFFTADGREISQEGINRIAASIIARVFDSEAGRRLVEYMYSSSSDEAKNINTTIKNVLGEIAKIEGKIELGQINPEMSIAKLFPDIVEAYLEARHRYGSYAEFNRHWVNQPSIYGDAYVDIGLVDPMDSPELRQIKIDMFQFYGENNRKVDALTQLWKRYADKVLSQPEYRADQIQLIPMEITPRHAIFESILQDLVDEGKSNEFGRFKRTTQQLPGMEAEEGSTLYQTRVIADVPPGGTPIPQYEGVMTEEVFTETTKPILDHMRYLTLDDLTSGKYFALADLPESTSTDVRNWMMSLQDQMASAKIYAMDYGEGIRNRALLNYRERYGFDDYLNLIFPYQFWFTRSMGEWGKRMIERPAWFRQYRRIKEHQDRMRQYGIPSRFEGKIRIPAPWLPDFMGDALYIDPLRQVFPFTEFMAPFEMWQQTGQNVQYTAQQIITSMVRAGEIDAERAQQAIGNMEDELWLQAMNEAQSQMGDQGELSAMNLASMMISPAMWWTYPYHVMKGTPEKLYPLPGTRLGQAMKTWGSPFDFVGQALAFPEEQLRKKFNLSSFGEWGDYYIDRHISNLAAEGAITPQEALIAMIERKGDAYDLAFELTEKEWALKLPGTQTALAIQEGKFGAILYTLPTTLFPSGILPEGEITQRGLKVEYGKAWDDYKSGNPKALNEFFDKYPEYQARLALFDPPEKRLTEFLISEIWDRWHELNKKNKTLVANQLGNEFEQYFLNGSTESRKEIDHETLAYWAQLMGGYVPETEITKAIKDSPLYMQKGLQVFRPEVLAQVEAFELARDKKFPDYKEQQSGYYAIPEDEKKERKAYLEQYPELKDYWNWKDEYYKKYPAVKMYMDERSKLYEDNEDIYQSLTGTAPGELPDELLGEGASTQIPRPEVPKTLTLKEQFEQERDILYPNYKALQDAYYDIPASQKSKRKEYLAQHPTLKEYWDWKHSYYKEIPVERLASEATAEEIISGEPALAMQMMFAYYTGQKVDGGARTMLVEMWETLGKPYSEFEVWLRVMYSIMTGKGR